MCSSDEATFELSGEATAGEKQFLRCHTRALCLELLGMSKLSDKAGLFGFRYLAQQSLNFTFCALGILLTCFLHRLALRTKSCGKNIGKAPKSHKTYYNYSCHAALLIYESFCSISAVYLFLCSRVLSS